MKPGSRALGVAESFRRDRERSTLAGVVTRASRVTDGFYFSSATVGGTDVTDAVCALYRGLDREDVQYVLVGGIALSWYNVLDMHALAEAVDRPVLSVTFEDSEGLEEPIRAAFDDPGERLATYRDQPPRRRVRVNNETAFVRAVGVDADTAREVVRAFTPEGGRPEPIRVARLAARGADQFRTRV